MAILVFALTVIGAGCKKKDATATPTPTNTVNSADANLAASNLTNADPTTIDTIINQNYNLAKTKAQEWKPDAVLVSLSVKMPSDLAVGNADETYIFGSATEQADWWSFSISESTSRYIRAIIPKEDYLGTDVKPINSSYWKMNYGKVFQLTDVAGGQSFRASNPGSLITATLHQTQPRGWLWWDVEYKSATNRLLIKVDPNKGEVVDESGNPLTPGTATTAPTATSVPTTSY